MSGLNVLNKDRCTVVHPYTPLDLKNLARYMFGAGRFHSDELGQFNTIAGPVRVIQSGTDGAVWLLGDRNLKSVEDFKYLMRPLPMTTPTFSGDVYLAFSVYGEQQFLLVPFKSQDLLWFRNIEQLKDYYDKTEISPAYKALGKRIGGSIMRSRSGVEVIDEDDLVESELA